MTRRERTTRTARAFANHRFVEAGEAFRQMHGLDAGAATGIASGPAHGSRSADDGASPTLDVIVIGGGQAGLSVGYHLARRGLRFAILDASRRIGDSWRNRWDSLRLFTPSRYNGLPGFQFPGSPTAFPPKDAMADYLEAYALRFRLPVRSGTRVRDLARDGGRYVVTTEDGRRLTAAHVVVAMGNYQQPVVPAFAAELAPAITQLHSSAYRHPGQLRPGGVLLVGGGNSGSEIAMELSRTHPTLMSGRDTGQVPFRPSSFLGRHLLVRLLLRVVFHRLLTIRTPMGRKVRPIVTKGGGPLIRVKREDLRKAGVERVGRTVGIRDGKPELADGRVPDVANVIWCTGFEPGFSWIRLPIVGDDGELRHTGGIADGEPGLYFVGLHFLYALSSGMVQGVGRDAARIVDVIAARLRHTAVRG
jgi:putative flavoprotein involved in K+ transport